MVTTKKCAIYKDIKAMADRGLLANDYDTAEELVEAYLQAEHLVRDRAMYPPMDTGTRERVRRDLLDKLRAHAPRLGSRAVAAARR